MEKQEDKKVQDSEEATSVGTYLKFTRLSQKKTVEDVAKVLCIRKSYINAIEEDNYEVLPPVPYGTGFVRSYAAYLGLNVERIVQFYKEESSPNKNTHLKPVVTKHPAVTLPSRKQILIGLTALVVLYFIWFAYSRSPKIEDVTADDVIEEIPATDEVIENFDEETKTSVDLQESPVEEEKLEKMTDKEEQAPVAVKDKPRVVIKLIGRSWLEIRDNKKVYISKIYDKGFSYDVPDLPGIVIKIGAVKNVEIYVDDKLTPLTTSPNGKPVQKIYLDKILNH